MAKWDVSKLEVVSEAELIRLIRSNLVAWATEEAEANDDSIINRYEEAKATFIEALQEEL
jgi:hypothetical protein